MFMSLFRERETGRERERGAKAMGRPPCCDKVGIKKGPWTPEEDIILVSYIQEHGPGNWRSVPTNTGLLRCSKSCRLRWTNYLRPGIKRGNFTPHEEGMIIHLQALLGNKWAAIASYLPQRTDNDIKNYWNTHLKKKMKKIQSAVVDPQIMASDSTSHHQFVSKSFSEKRSSSSNLDMIITNNIVSTSEAVSSSTSLKLNHSASSTTYASSTENISRLLQGWMRSSPKSNAISTPPDHHHHQKKKVLLLDLQQNNSLENSTGLIQSPKSEHERGHGLGSNEELESILSFDNLNNSFANNNWDKTSPSTSDCAAALTKEADDHATDHEEIKPNAIVNESTKLQRSDQNDHPPLSFLENWLLGETAAQVEEMMELPPIF